MNRLEKLKRVDNLLRNVETTSDNDEALALMDIAAEVLIEILDEQRDRR